MTTELTETARRNAAATYLSRFEELSTTAALLRAEGGRPLAWRIYARAAEIARRAADAETHDPEPAIPVSRRRQ